MCMRWWPTWIGPNRAGPRPSPIRRSGAGWCAWPAGPPSEIESLGAFGGLVGRARLLGALERGGLGYRDVPPALGRRDRRERIRFDIHNGGLTRRPGPLQAVPELRDGAGPQHVG